MAKSFGLLLCIAKACEGGEVGLEAESAICTDGSGATCQEVCCFNGATLEFCCSYAYPVCDAIHGVCHTGDDSNDFMQAIAPVKAEPEAAKVEQPQHLHTELEAESAICTDGSGATCQEVCCFNGATLEFCCSYAYPVCDAIHGVCHTGDDSNDFMQAIAPVKAEPDTAKVEQPQHSHTELEAESAICTDGSGATCQEVCCFNGATLEFCCSYAYPVCDAIHGVCHTGDDSNDFMQAILPVKAEPEATMEQPQHSHTELEAESAICTDGSGATCQEVCCFNGATLEFCCSYAYPVCDAIHGVCHTGDDSNDFMQAIAPVKVEPEEMKVEQPQPLKAELAAESEICTDGSGNTCEEVCCFNGATLSFCCFYAYPICDAIHQSCHTGDDSNAAFMQAIAPVSSTVVV